MTNADAAPARRAPGTAAVTHRLRLFSETELAAAAAQIADAFEDACKAGLPADAAALQPAGKFADLVMERSGAVADAMQQQGQAAEQHRRSGEAQLAAQWGDALGLHYTATLAAAELGALTQSARNGRRYAQTAARSRWPGSMPAPARHPSKSMPCCPPAIPAEPGRGHAPCTNSRSPPQ